MKNLEEVDKLYEWVEPLEDLESYRKRMLSYYSDEVYQREVISPVSDKIAETPPEYIGINPRLIKSIEEISDLEREVFKKRASKSRIYDTPLVAVHATNYFPNKGVIRPGGLSYTLAGRRTVHFSLNGVATAGPIGPVEKWNEGKYYIAAPLSDLMAINYAIGGCPADFFFAGEVKLPKDAKLFSSKEDLEKFIQKVSWLYQIGNRGWDNSCGDGEGKEFMDENNLFPGIHAHHWTKTYEDLRMNSLPHDEAIKRIYREKEKFRAFCRDVSPEYYNPDEFEKEDQRFKVEVKALSYELPNIEERVLVS